MSKLFGSLMQLRTRRASSEFESLDGERFKLNLSADIARRLFGALVAIGAASFGYFYLYQKFHWTTVTFFLSLTYVGMLLLLVFVWYVFTCLRSETEAWETAKRLWGDPRNRLLRFGCIMLLGYSVMLSGVYLFTLFDGDSSWGTFLANLHEFSAVELYTKLGVFTLVLFTGIEGYAYFMKAQYQRRYRLSSQVHHYPFKLWVGQSTGQLAKFAHGAGLPPKRQVCLSWQDAAQNIVIFGGIGSGKTTRAIHPLLMQLFDKQCGGLIFDIKGNFQTAVEACARVTSSEQRLRVIGPGHNKINLLEGLTPEVAASFLKSSLMLADNKQNTFFVDTAAELCRNALGVLSFFPAHYHLSGLQRYLFDVDGQQEWREQVEALIMAMDTQPDKVRLLRTYMAYQETVFDRFDEKVKMGVLASVSQVLSPFNHPELIDAFCSISTCQMEEVLDGTVFLVQLPLAVWGLGGKVADNFIKMRFFNVMQQRERQPTWNQSRLVFFLCDEFQEIVSASKDGLSDLNFWDKSRSSKTMGIISAQSVSSFYAAIGDRDCANALLQNFRQKICFRTEDQATLDFLNRLTGRVEIEKISYGEQSGSSGNLSNATNSQHSRSKTVTKVEKSVLDPQLIRNLKKDQAVALLVIDGQSRDDVLDMKAVYM
jgi:hypothetical protein